RERPEPLVPPPQFSDAGPGVHQDLRVSRQAARATRRRQARLRGPRDPRRLRRGLRPRRAGAVPQPALHRPPRLSAMIITRRAGRLAVVLALLGGVVALLPHGHSRAAETPEIGETIVKRGRIASDLYAFGGDVDVGADVSGDLIAAGGRGIRGHRGRGGL